METLKIITDLAAAHPEWSLFAAGLSAEWISRKIPKAVPILRLTAALLTAVSNALDKVPGLKNKE